MKTFFQITLLSGLACTAIPVSADTANGFSPYGQGFSLPENAGWGGWSRGSGGTLYAEWDTFLDKSHDKEDDRTAAPDVGKAGVNTAFIGWNNGTFMTSVGNLYNFSVPEKFTLTAKSASPIRAVLQVETTGVQMDYAAVTLNGQKPTQQSITFSDPNFPTPAVAGQAASKTDLVRSLFYWDLPSAAAQYDFNFGGGPHLSLTQVAVDIGQPKSASQAPARNKVIADFAAKTLSIPCIEVRKTAFDGYYNVTLNIVGEQWLVSKADATTATACNINPADSIKTHELLQSTGLLGTTIVNTLDLKKLNQKTVADFAYKMLLLPCVEVKNSTFNGYYHAGLDIVGSSGAEWRLKDVKVASVDMCN